jgi:hypothetical protein
MLSTWALTAGAIGILLAATSLSSSLLLALLLLLVFLFMRFGCNFSSNQPQQEDENNHQYSRPELPMNGRTGRLLLTYQVPRLHDHFETLSSSM